MDLAISSKSQTLILIPCTAFSSSFCSNLRLVRRDFLGNAYALRPPASSLHARRKHRKLGLRVQPPRFLFRASMESHSSVLIVVVALATFSAVSVVLLNRYRRKKNVREVSRPPNFALLELGRDVVNWVFDHQILGFGKLPKDKERSRLRDKIGGSIYPSEDEQAPLLLQTSALMDEEAFVTETLLAPGSDILSSVTDPLHKDGTVFDPCAGQHLTLSKEMTASQVDGHEEEIASDVELPILEDNIKLNAASLVVNNSPAETNAYNKANDKPVEEGKKVNYNISHGESVREELHIFYEANGSATKSSASSSTLKSFSYATSLNRNKYSSLRRNTALRGAELSGQVSLQTAEYVQGKAPIGNYKEGLPHRRRGSGNDNGFPRDRKIERMSQKSNKSLPQFPDPNGKHVTDKKHPSEDISAYNRLLKAGRLTECVELLEGMERSGLLDMNKVYHVKFFEKCKSQKAVNEAFRFTKLILNPTLSTFNMLLSVCSSAQDLEGAFRVSQLVQKAGLKADCKLYTTLISTCAKSGKVDAMFEVFHEMVNVGVEPNVHTYGALIDGCGRAGQVAKAFGAYGIMRSKSVKPDRVVFNALITACGQSGAVDRAFDVLAEMGAETQPIDPDHVTIGALIKACANAGQVDRAREVYEMIHQYNIKGTPDVYTIAVNCCSQTGDWEFASNVYNDMNRKGVVPDEMFLSALIDVAGHAGKLDAAFEILQEARVKGIEIGIVSYSSLMGACSNAKNWKKALELYEDLKSMKMKQTISTVNALITALCDGDQLPKAMEVLSEMKELGLCPNSITYSILIVASEKKDDLEAGLMLFSQAKKDGIILNLVMSRCIVGICLRGFEKACTLGEPVLSFGSGRPHVDNKWTSMALMVYRETIVAGVMPTTEVLSQVLGCLKLPYDATLKNKLIENLGVSVDPSRRSSLSSIIDGFGEYDPRAFSLVEEAASLGIVPCTSFKESPIVVDVRNLQIHTAEVYLLTVLKGLKHRLAAGAKLPNVNILLPVEKTNFMSQKGERTIDLAGRVSQAVTALLRRVGLHYQGNESYGKIRINGLVLKRWFQPKLTSPFSGRPGDWSSSQSRLGKGIMDQQRDIRTGNLSLD